MRIIICNVNVRSFFYLFTNQCCTATVMNAKSFIPKVIPKGIGTLA